MKVLFDILGLQAHSHRFNNNRLGAIVDELKTSTDNFVDFTEQRELKSKDLENCDVLILTTRYRPKEQVKYENDEITTIYDFVDEGGGLLLMSNHGDSHTNPNDTRFFDALLACEFKVLVEKTHFQHPKGILQTLEGDNLDSSHPIIQGSPDSSPVESIVTRNCCSLRARNYHRIASLPREMINVGSFWRNLPAQEDLFALSLDSSSGLSPESKGRVVFMADSGFIGNSETKKPGPGLSNEGDNLKFVMNAINWLGRKL
jgi:hypothetical protein